MGQLQGKLIFPTPQITTGDWTTVNDATAQNKPGGLYAAFDSKGRPVILQYVQLNATTPATLVAGSAVYYKDSTATIVTNVIAEAATYAASSSRANMSAAGVLANASATNGYFIFILVKGTYDTIVSPGSVVQGDILELTNAANTPPTISVWVRVAAGTAPAHTEWQGGLYCIALASESSSKVACFVRGGLMQ